MHSDTLESDLRSYARRRTDSVFQRIHQPLVQLIKWICRNKYQSITYANYGDVEQQAILRIMRDMRYYNPKRGMTATSFARMLLTQEIVKQRNAYEDNVKCEVLYDGNKDNRTYEFDHESIVHDYRRKLIEYLATAPTAHRIVIRSIINNLSNPDLVDMRQPDRLRYYAKQCHCSVWIVGETIRRIRKAGLHKDI
jgi:hypothetical protein